MIPNRQRQQTQATRRFMAGISVKTWVDEQGKSTSPSLSEAARLLLSFAVLRPQDSITKHYESAGLSAGKGRRALEELLTRGYVKPHKIARRGRGGQVTLVEALNSSNGLLVELGIKRPKRVLKGGWLHDVCGRCLGDWARAHGYRHWHEKTLGAKTYDFVHEENGDLIAWEVWLSGSARLAAEAALKGLQNEGIQELRMVCRDVKAEKTLEQAVAEIDGLGFYRDKMKTYLILDIA